MKAVSTEQIKKIHTLMNQYAKQRGFAVEKEEKEAFVLECPNGRSTSAKPLYYAEASVMLDSLQKMLHSTGEYQQADRKRKRILYYAHQMNWTKMDKVDIERVNNWCVKYGYLHKPLMQHSANELTALVRQFDKMYRAFLETF